MVKNTSKAVLFFILIISLIPQILVQTGCANIMPPLGGLRDTIPPILLKASPADSSKNFKDSHITLTFDEFIQLDNPRTNLILSPLPKKEPEVTSSLRTIIVKLKDTLQPNTTYTINFGNAIRDVNEGNIDKNFTYIFSTGSYFDSLMLTGKVISAETGKPDSTLVVILHQHGEDSAVFNENPRFLTHLDSAGNFHFRNLPYGKFYIYALEDMGAHRYTSPKQLFAFADTPVVLSIMNKPVVLYAFAEEPGGSRTSSVPQLGTKQKVGGGNAEKRLRIQTNLLAGQLDLLNGLELNFEQPLKNLDTSLIHFSTDSTFTPITNYQLIEDTSKKKLTLQYQWKENTLYHVIIDKNFAQDTLGKALLKTDTLAFKTKKNSDYGSLTIRFTNFDPSINPVLLFVNNNTVVKSLPLTSSKINLSLFPPGDFELRILQDRNKNGKWDTGEFFGKRLQPEIVKPVSRKINVKPDWENDFDIAL
jgi:hypothetical protein